MVALPPDPVLRVEATPVQAEGPVFEEAALDDAPQPDRLVRVPGEHLELGAGSRTAAGAVDASDDEASAEETSRPHSLIGQALPFESVDKVGGGTLDFSDVKQITVIDLWATWCGPCVAGMPHLQEVAEAYADRGVKVYGLSVDGKLDEVRRFFKGFDQPAYSLGFLGREGFEIMDVSGIPSLFVVGPDGKVAEYFSGYGGEGDTRLEEAIDRLLEPAKEPDSAG